MPLYEYECLDENRRFEVIQKFSDDPLTACPDCGAAVRKVLSAPAVHFKGSGWYVTDYARAGQKDDQKDAQKGETKANGSSESGSEAKSSETKSAEKTETKKAAKPASSATPKE